MPKKFLRSTKVPSLCHLLYDVIRKLPTKGSNSLATPPPAMNHLKVLGASEGTQKTALSMGKLVGLEAWPDRHGQVHG